MQNGFRKLSQDSIQKRFLVASVATIASESGVLRIIMGKQSTLGKFWGKPGAGQDPVKTEEDKREAEKKDGNEAASSRDGAGKATEGKASAPISQGSALSSTKKSKYSSGN